MDRHGISKTIGDERIFTTLHQALARVTRD
jgi:hypothetical protein